MCEKPRRTSTVDHLDDCVGAGRLATAARLLGRPYAVRGAVQHGDQRGRALGFPTANLPMDPSEVHPPRGVYAGWATLADGSRHVCAINIGIRPTIYDQTGQLLLEAHLLDFDGNLYGQRIEVEPMVRIRVERRFASLEALVAQLDADVQQVRDLRAAGGLTSPADAMPVGVA